MALSALIAPSTSPIILLSHSPPIASSSSALPMQHYVALAVALTLKSIEKTCSIAQSPSKRLPSNALSQSSSTSYIANAVLLSLLHHCSSPTKNLTMHGHSLAILAVSLSTISPSILKLLVPYITHCLLPTI